MVVVNAELYCVHNAVEYINTNPIILDIKNANTNQGEFQCSNSRKHCRQSSTHNDNRNNGIDMNKAL